MNDQQRAAMQMALDLLELDEKYPRRIRGSYPKEVITALRSALAQPQGEWVDLTVDEIAKALNTADSHNTIDSYRAVIAKFKSKNTPPVVPQGEPVAWKHEPTNYKYTQFKKIPLYTTSPSVEANDYVLCEVQQEWYVKGWKDAVEKAAKLLEAGVLGHSECAAAIRSMK